MTPGAKASVRSTWWPNFLPAAISTAALIVFAMLVGVGLAGFRLNLTPSEPLGLWQVLRITRELRKGDMVFVCPPATPVMRQARARGYLRYGLCAGAIAPLIKTIVAISGQSVDVTDEVFIDRKRLAHSHIQPRDGKGRSLTPYTGGIVAPGTVYLHSDFPGSFDSRYFGPLPIEKISGFAHEVWTYDP
jgi:conjugative transfer signal peptidase TraF